MGLNSFLSQRHRVRVSSIPCALLTQKCGKIRTKIGKKANIIKSGISMNILQSRKENTENVTFPSQFVTRISSSLRTENCSNIFNQFTGIFSVGQFKRNDVKKYMPPIALAKGWYFFDRLDHLWQSKNLSLAPGGEYGIDKLSKINLHHYWSSSTQFLNVFDMHCTITQDCFNLSSPNSFFDWSISFW